MSSLIYNTCLYGIFRSTIHFDADFFKVMLVTSGYIPDKINDKVRSDILYEVPNGGGYLQGGKEIKTSMSNDTMNNRIDVILGGTTWNFSTIEAGGAVYYKSRGFPSNDDLICYIQFDRQVSSVDGDFAITMSRIRIQN